MGRAFLYFIATMIVLVIIGLFALNYWSDKATEIAKRGGLSAEMVNDLRRELLGIAK